MSEKLIESEIKENNTEDESSKIDIMVLLGDFLRGFLKLAWLIVVLALVFGCINYAKDAVSYRPVYRSQATFTVVTGYNDSLADNSYNFYYDSGKAEQLGRTFPHILSSQLLTDAIKEDLGVDFINAQLSAKTISDSNMVTMTATSDSPEDAKKVLESAIKVYPGVARIVLGDIKFNIIEAANLPMAPSNTVNYRHSFMKGQLIGVILGFIVLVIYVLLRKTVHDTEELDKDISIPCVVSLPLLKQKKRSKNVDYFPTILDKGIGAGFRENLEALRLRIEKEMPDKKKNVLMITSTWEGEGKSLVSANLACLLAKHDKKVLFIDGDLRKQELFNRMNVETCTDFKDLDLENLFPALDFTQDDATKVYFLASKEPFDNISYLLANNLPKIVETAKEYFDYVIIDTPPAGYFEDTLLIRSYADAILYVVKQDYAPKSKILETMAQLDAESTEDSAKFIGYVFNGVTGILGEYGYGKYGYGKYGYGKYGYGKYGYGKYGYGKYGYGDYGYGYGEKKKEKTEG